MDGESQSDTPARGASPRPWRLGNRGEGISVCSGDRMVANFATYYNSGDEHVHEVNEANAMLALTAVNQRAAHIALLRRALAMTLRLPIDDGNDFAEALSFAEDLRAALAGADK